MEGDKLTCTDVVYHEINVSPVTQPINEPPYHLPFKHTQEIDRKIQKLQEENIIASSRSLQRMNYKITSFSLLHTV